MNVKITYCNMWNYLPTAFRVREEILQVNSKANVEFIQGSGGDFIVEVEGKVIFSKNDDNTKRFPRENEIPELIKDAGY